MSLLRQAEEVLIDEQPIIPIAFYMAKQLIRPSVQGHSLNSMKVHPLHLMRKVEGSGAAAP
jgi:hypothetical protein